MSNPGAGALRVDLRPLRAERDATLVVTCHEPLASRVDEIPFIEPVEGTLTLVNLGAVVRAEGRFKTVAGLTCDRCAQPFGQRLEATVEEDLAWSPDGPAGAGPGEGGDYLIRFGDTILLDVEALARDVLVLALPMVARCSPDCPGLCDGCGANLRVEPCRCGKASAATEAVDPRLGPLAAWQERGPSSRSGG
jgi:uncharacterized protein